MTTLFLKELFGAAFGKNSNDHSKGETVKRAPPLIIVSKLSVWPTTFLRLSESIMEVSDHIVGRVQTVANHSSVGWWLGRNMDTCTFSELLFDSTKKGICTHFLFLAVGNALFCGIRDVQCSKNTVASERWWVVCVLGTRWPLSPMTWPGCNVVRQVVHSSDTM